MAQQPPQCPCCDKPLAQGKHDVCFSDDKCCGDALHGKACYRYFLQATLPNPPNKGICLFLMLNPSTANEDKPDPTLDKCRCFASWWGYGTLWICNLFAVRGKDAPVALSHACPTGPANDKHVREAASKAQKIVLAWGTSGYKKEELFLDRVRSVVTMLVNDGWAEKLHRLNGFSDGRGQPRHPMGRGKHYLSLDTPCVRFTSEELENFIRHGIAHP